MVYTCHGSSGHQRHAGARFIATPLFLGLVAFQYNFCDLSPVQRESDLWIIEKEAGLLMSTTLAQHTRVTAYHVRAGPTA